MLNTYLQCTPGNSRAFFFVAGPSLAPRPLAYLLLPRFTPAKR
jgi:hypothetical protein